MEITVGRRGEQGFAITDKGVSGKHLKLTTLADGKVKVEDLGSSNGTFIDGVRIIKKTVNANTIVQMGSSYTFRISDALPAVQQQVSTPQQPAQQSNSFSIAHLERVWERYDQSIKALKEKNKNIALMSRVSPIFTLGSGAIAGVARAGDWGDGVFTLTSILTVVGLVIMIYSIVQSKSFDFDKEKEALDDKFIKDYVCPNLECRHFLGFQRYSILSQNKSCSYCRCKLTT